MSDPIAFAAREALWVTLQLGGPPLLAMLLIGLAIALFQALTQINEASLAFLPKLITLGVALLVLGPAMAGTLRGYAAGLFDAVIAAGLR